MKKYLNMILAAATVMLLFACNKNTPDEVAPRFAIVQSHLEVAPDGGDCTIEVEADQAITVTSEREWCTVAVNGKIITATATANQSIESRYCRLKLQSAGKVLYATVQQYGQVVAGLEELSDVTAPVEGRTVEVKIKSNVPIEINTPESWIHLTVEDKKLIIEIDKNEDPVTRFATVTYSAGTVTGSFEVTQYPELTKPESWVITEGTPSFDYPKFVTTASLSAGTEDMYVMRYVPKASVEGEIDDWIFDNLAVQVRNEILAKVEAAPETVFKDYLTTGTDPVIFNDIQVGDAYVIALGFGENGFVSGRYQYKEITVGDIRPMFYKWTGKWKVHRENAKATADDTWTISVKEKDKTLLIKGIEGLSNADGRFDVVATVDDNGRLVLKTQNTTSYEDSSRGTVTVLLSGYFKPGSSTYTSSTGKDLLYATMSEDFNSATMEGAAYTSSGVEYHFYNIQFFGRYKKAGSTSYSAVSWTNGTTDIAQTITRIVD